MAAENRLFRDYSRFGLAWGKVGLVCEDQSEYLKLYGINKDAYASYSDLDQTIGHQLI